MPAWTYRGSAARGIHEVGTVAGCAVALPLHFHDEDQFTFVIAGRRRFRIGGRLREVAAGEGLLVPAGTVHGSYETPEGVVGFNVYAAPGRYAVGDLLDAAHARWTRGDAMAPHDFATLVAAHRLDGEAEATTRRAAHRPRESVAAAAARQGLSREHFSRVFARSHGLPPHRFALVHRLNIARERLRRGGALAGIACEAGFADQSHFGRCFRRTFGVTPGGFRAGWVTNVPDARPPAR